MEKDLPKGWSFETIQNSLEFVIGGDWGIDPDKDSEIETEKVYCIRGSEIKNWDIEKGKTSVLRKIKSSSLEKRNLIEGDILLEISGGGPDQPVGRTVVIDQVSLNLFDCPIICTNFLRLLRFKKINNSFYINYFLKSFYLSGEIVKYQGGSNNLRNLKYKDFETINIPLPPLPEQERIVAKLDAIFAHLEVAKQGLEKIPVLLKEFRQAVLTLAVTGKLTEEWRESEELFDWINNPIEIISSLVTKGASPNWQGINYVEEYTDDSIMFITSENVGRFEILKNKLKFLEKKFNKNQKRSILEKGDVLTNIVGGSIGRTTVWNEEYIANINQAVCLIRPEKNKLDPNYLCIYLNSSQGLRSIMSDVVDVARANISLKNIKETIVPLPSIQEQTAIVRRVESLFAKADAIEAQYKKLKEQIDQLPQAFLAKAFRGEM